jgi:peptidoglycan/xylan/chitin deacetylase (PgdA/CDA1 family)
MQTVPFERDWIGYGNIKDCHSQFAWPDGKRIAVTFVVNFEEGSESSKEVVHEIRETARTEKDLSNYCVESHFEYGTRVGYWRVMEVFERYDAKVTLSACGRAVERSPWLAKDAVKRGHEIAAHGYLWEPHDNLTESEEIVAIERSIDAIKNVTGQPPLGWHTRSKRSPNTRRLLQERGFLYSDDAYNDDTPYFVDIAGKPHLILPYAFDTNDMQFQENSRFNTASSFAQYCIDSFDWMCAREEGIPRMMTIGLHLRIIGRAGRMLALEKILEHLTKSEKAWIVPRIVVARHWLESTALGQNPSQSPLKIEHAANQNSPSNLLLNMSGLVNLQTFHKEFKTLLVINPNTSREATRFIEKLFAQYLPDVNVIAITASKGVPTICTEEAYAIGTSLDFLFFFFLNFVIVLLD